MISFRNASLLLTLLLVAAYAFADAAPAAPKVNYSNKTLGFSLNPPDFGAAGDTTSMPVMFRAPAKNGFSNNVNIMIQPQKTTRNKYVEGNVAGLSQIQGQLISKKELLVSGREAAILDYDGVIQGKKMHFLALAVVDTDRVYLVTCTALPDDFAGLKDEFQKCLESFKLDGVPKL